MGDMWEITKSSERRLMTASAWKAVEHLEFETIVSLLCRSGPEKPETLRGSGYTSRSPVGDPLSS
jgi:hypothetical protein